MHPKLRIAKAREKPIRQYHPWVFSGSLLEDPAAEPGALVDLVTEDGEFLARGYYNPHSQIRIRLLTWKEDEAIDRPFWKHRLERGIAERIPLRTATNAIRLINSESDGLPGLIVDQYGETVVIQILTAGIEARAQELTELLFELLTPRSLYERSDESVRKLEGLQPRAGLITGEEPPPLIEIQEHGLRYQIDIRKGHKTGFYIDQRDNRKILGGIAHDRSVLNVFCYTGGFTLNALSGGARSVLSIDSSETALDLARANLVIIPSPLFHTLTTRCGSFSIAARTAFRLF